MKIASFGVTHFRAICGDLAKNTINFKNSNTIFIFGQNNVGKSSFLNAYNFFYESVEPTDDDLHRKDCAKNIEFELVVELDAHDFKKIEKLAPTKVDSIKQYLDDGKILKIRRKFSPTAGTSGKKIKFERTNLTWNPSSREWDETSYGTIGLDGVFQACLPKPIFIRAMPTEEEVETIINVILAEKAKNSLKDEERDELKDAKDKIKSLQEKMYNPASIAKYKKNVNDHFQRLFPETQIELDEEDKMKWTEDKLGKKFHIHFEKLKEDGSKDIDVPTSYEKIGHGAVRTAIFALMLMRDVAEEFIREENRKDYLVLYEEPELFLHPKLLRELRALIYEVSEEDYPYQVLCASHSPQMIDITKTKSSLARMIRHDAESQLFQIDESYLKEAKGISTNNELRQEMFEVLRFNPFICESFYADEVVLIEGPTEEIILRGYLEEDEPKNIFIVNCGTVNNIPFYQKIFSKFSIKYHVICDTDNQPSIGFDKYGNPIFNSGIQGSIYEQIKTDCDKSENGIFILRAHNPTFETAHNDSNIPEGLRYKDEDYAQKNGKPFNANLYWRNVLQPNLQNADIIKVPIIASIRQILV